MSRILVPSTGAENWRAFLAKPDLHWAVGYSARTLAHAWEAASGLPPEIAAILNPVFGTVEPLVTMPEHKTPLPGGSRESQSDVFTLLRHVGGTIACTIEGKVNEPFGPTVARQMANASPGRTERLNYLCELLGIGDCPTDVHYQLLHRTASSLVEAERFSANDAAMIVHSFSPERRWFDAFTHFCEVLGGGTVEVGEPKVVIVPDGKRLVLGWACGDSRFLEM